MAVLGGRRRILEAAREPGARTIDDLIGSLDGLPCGQVRRLVLDFLEGYGFDVEMERRVYGDDDDLEPRLRWIRDDVWYRVVVDAKEI